MGFIPLNEPFEGSVRHHIDKEHIVYIPEELHTSVHHNVRTGKGMVEINNKVFQMVDEIMSKDNFQNSLFEMDGFKLSLSMLWVERDTPFQGKVAKGVVLLIPVYNTSRRCWSVLEKALYRLDPLPEKVIFLENNSSDNTLRLIWNFKLPHEVIRLWFRKDAAIAEEHIYDTIANVRDILFTRARTYGAKLAIFLDDDCIPERRDFIKMFLDDNLDICGGMYTRNFPEGFYVATKWSVYLPSSVLPKSKLDIEEYKRNNYPAVLYKYETLERDGRRFFECSCTSGGALALSQKVLQDSRLEFFPIHKSDWGGASEDFGFCLYAGKLGYKIFLDFTIKFAHLGLHFKYAPKSRPWIEGEHFEYED